MTSKAADWIWIVRLAPFAAVLVVALARQGSEPTLFAAQDKIEHVAAFLILGVAACLGKRGQSFWWAAAGVGVFAFAVEACQWAFAPTRTPTLMDAYASLIGGALGIACVSAHRRLTSRPTTG